VPGDASSGNAAARAAHPNLLKRELGRYFAAQQFLTRLPCPSDTPYAPKDLAASIGWFSLVGVPVGVVVGLIAAGLRSAVTPTFAAVIAVALGAAATGAFHEDGFADTCDAFGGYTPERRRDIMRDSRIGTFGGLGLIALFLAKVSALSEVVARLPWWRTLLVAVCAHTVSRAATVLAIKLIPPVNDPTSKTNSYRVSFMRLLCALSVPAVPLSVYVFRWDAAMLWGAIIVVMELASPFFRRFSDGISGDGLGAVNQVVEVLTWGLAARMALGR
jgi:adenosylcobinamide-GDP ribazoletransferase